MPRKSALLLYLLNLVLKPIAGQTSAPSNQLVALSQPPPAHDREAWRAYWKAQGQPWRTEPEIDMKRQRELTERRAIVPDIEKEVYPLKGMKLNRADVEWLLATHQNGRGPVLWDEEKDKPEYERRTGLDLRGADLRKVDLRHLPLANLLGGLKRNEWFRGILEQQEMAATHLEGAVLFQTHLEGAFLSGTHLEGANLIGAYLTWAFLGGAQLKGADLSIAKLDPTFLGGAQLEETNLSSAEVSGTNLRDAILSNREHIGPKFVDVEWNDTNLTVVDWAQVTKLGDEWEAQQKQAQDGKKKEKDTRLKEYQEAVRANRQLAVALQVQGLNEDAARFAYRAQVLQKRVQWFQMTQRRMKLRQRMQVFEAWLFSWVLFLFAGYGYKPSRSFLAYLLVISGFATAYYFLGHTVGPTLSPLGAFVFSMTSFHGRGFFPGNNISLDDPLTVLAAFEAFVGLIIEVTFIATLTQRLFNR